MIRLHLYGRGTGTSSFDLDVPAGSLQDFEFAVKQFRKLLKNEFGKLDKAKEVQKK